MNGRLAERGENAAGEAGVEAVGGLDRREPADAGVEHGGGEEVDHAVLQRAEDLPTCSYAENPTDSKRVEEATRSVLDLLKDRAALLTSLLQDKSGETVVRERIQSDKHLLNVEAVMFTAMTVVQELKRRLEDNIGTQSTLLKQLKVEEEGEGER